MDRTDLLRARVPRYTSYPPIPLWSSDPAPSVVDQALGRVSAPAEVYVHVPFCFSQCSYCGCTMVVSQRRASGPNYLDDLRHQVTALPLPTGQLSVRRIHLGGGTPTWLQPGELVELMGILRLRFSPTDDAEISVEAAPHATRVDHIEALAALGFNRLSLGVQSFDPEVLKAVSRPPAEDRVVSLIDAARRQGMTGLNLDLMRGLPGQTEASFRRTLERAIALAPDRLAVFGYAHVPHLKAHQGRIDAAALPGGALRQTLAGLAREVLGAAGYVAIGMDHFARPEDPLAQAVAAGTLHRNFMGYAAGGRADMIGLGTSAISEVAGVCWQDDPHLGRWQKKVRSGEPLATRVCVLSADDQLRRDVIHTLLCNGRVDLDIVAAAHGVDPATVFATERTRLAPFVDAGLAHLRDWRLSVPEDLPEALRPVAAVFDTTPGAAGRYSLAV